MNREELRLEILRRADMVGSDFVSPDELDLMIDSSVEALGDLLVASYGAEYWSKVFWLQTNPGTDPDVAWPRLELNPAVSVPTTDTGYASCFALPSDFRRLVRVQFVCGTVTRPTVRIGTAHPDGEGWALSYNTQSGENWIVNATDKRAYPMHRIDTAGQLMDFTPQDWTQTRVAYRVRYGAFRFAAVEVEVPSFGYIYRWQPHNGAVIEFLPVPRGRYAVQVTYVPKPQLLPEHPFVEYIVFDCAALCIEKQEGDSATLRALQQRVVRRIETESSPADDANPPMTVDVYGANRLRSRRGEPPEW